MMLQRALLRLAENRQADNYVRHASWLRRTTRRFVAGETREEALTAAAALNAANVSVTFALLGESVTDAAQAAAAAAEYVRLLGDIERTGADANVSVKLTALGLDISENECRKNLGLVTGAAGAAHFVRIDMEGSAYTERTLRLFYEMWNAPRSDRNCGVVIQAYLRRSASDVEGLISAGARVRLCKGAYRENRDVAFTDKPEVDASYVRLMERLLEAGRYPALATHDGRIIRAAQEFAQSHGIAKDQFEFQMLYGIRREYQKQLASEGYRVRVYCPYGLHWYPYFMRRLAERPANLWFVLRSLGRD